MKKLIQVLMLCGLFVFMGGTASGQSFSDLEDTWYKNPEKVFKNMKQLAESGDGEALYAMGEYYFGFLSENCYDSEKNLTKDCVVNTKEALKWYKIGADKGVDGSASDIATLYQYGYGVKKDLIEEKKWLETSLKQGADSGQRRLNEINKILKEKKEKAEKSKFNKLMQSAEKYRTAVKNLCKKKDEDISKCITFSSCIVAANIEGLKHDDRGKKFKKTVEGGLLSKGSVEKAFAELKKSANKDELLKKQVEKFAMLCLFGNADFSFGK